MSRKRIAATAAAAAAAIAILSGCAVTHHAAAPLTHTVTTQTAATHTTPTHKAATATATADPAVLWLASSGGQAQVTFNQEVDTLAGDLEIEAHAPTVANHLIFEADARTVHAQAEKILSTSALLPTVNRAAYQHMLHASSPSPTCSSPAPATAPLARTTPPGGPPSTPPTSPSPNPSHRLIATGAHRTTSGPARKTLAHPLLCARRLARRY